MSAALIEAPVTSTSQLFFAWPESDIATLPDCSGSEILGEYLPAKSFKSSPEIAARKIEPAKPAARAKIMAESNSFGDRRVGEVRIGSVMIKLLKRYGITDEEIAEGLAEYAQKNCQSAAS